MVVMEAHEYIQIFGLMTVLGMVTFLRMVTFWVGKYPRDEHSLNYGNYSIYRDGSGVGDTLIDLMSV